MNPDALGHEKSGPAHGPCPEVKNRLHPGDLRSPIPFHPHPPSKHTHIQQMMTH